jgi:hypothetical protein
VMFEAASSSFSDAGLSSTPMSFRGRSSLLT